MGEWNQKAEFETKICEDNKTRTVLRSKEEIYKWIKKKYDDVDKKNSTPENPSLVEMFIDLSDCVINIPNNKFTLSFLSENEDNNIGVFDPINSIYKVKVFFKCENSIIHNLDFSETEFLKGVYFKNTTFVGSANFSETIFHDNCTFRNIKFTGKSSPIKHASIPIIFDDEFDTKKNKVISAAIYFDKSVFKKDFIFNGIDTEKDISLLKVCFEGSANLGSNTCKGTIFLDYSRIKSDIFIIGSGLSDLKEYIIEPINKINLKYAIIDGKIYISNHYITLINLNGSTFEKYSTLQIVNCIIKTLNMLNIHNWGHIKLENNKTQITDAIILTDSDNSGLISINDNSLGSIKDRETACILKDASINKNNHIDAIKYRSIEMNIYLKDKKEELKNWIKKNWICAIVCGLIFLSVLICTYRYSFWGIVALLLFCSFFCKKTVQEYVLLFLNTYSNNNWLSWTRGIIFTIAVSVLFYTLFAWVSGEIYFTYKWNVIVNYAETYWKSVMQYLLIINFDQIKNLDKISVWSYFWFLTGKIFIGYGIYQTISAFRKHGK